MAFTDPTGASRLEQSAYLEVQGSSGPLSRFGLSDAPVVIGRVADCELRLDDPMVSRKHARIERRDGRWRIVDLGSHNGTRLNNAAVKEQSLRDGDVVGIGPFSLTFRHRSKAIGQVSNTELGQTILAVNEPVSIQTLNEIQAPHVAVEHLNSGHDLIKNAKK